MRSKGDALTIHYRTITVYTSEEARWKGRPLHDAVVNLVRGRKIAARCLVIRGIAGCYESGEVATHSIVDLSTNLPLEIRIVLPAAEAEQLLVELEPMVVDGMILVEEARVHSHRTTKRLLPRGLRVRDAMTGSPSTVPSDTPVTKVARLLLEAEFNGVPVVDAQGRVQGIVTQTDLISRGGMPLRLGLLAELDEPAVEARLAAFEAQTAEDIMTSDLVTARDDEPLERAVDRMVGRDLKRLPVVDVAGHLVGMLSRVDVLRTVAHTSPAGKPFPSTSRYTASRRLRRHSPPTTHPPWARAPRSRRCSTCSKPPALSVRPWWTRADCCWASCPTATFSEPSRDGGGASRYSPAGRTWAVVTAMPPPSKA